MEASRIRESFLSFFEARGHRRVASSSLIPPPETGLLLTNAGMNQFLPYFLGKAEPPFRRATTAQKCFRTVDIDNVGHTARHLTFFEMLGNFSFADYFKEEAIAWAHELVTEAWGIDHELLWVTVFETDDEAAAIWNERVGIAPERIVRRGKKDNYWWVPGRAGGPCSEIYVDRGPRYGPDGGPAVDEERFLEIWNLVFMQDQVDDEGDPVGELPGKNIDTGSGLERVAVVLQGRDGVFDTDLLRPLVAVAESLAGRRYGEDERADVSLRVLAEHGRATTFLIADGVQPSNEGRGYVLRRMLRRLVSHARRLGIERPVMERLAETTIELMGEAYPELQENRAFVLQVATSEEERFAATLRQGMVLFEQEAARAGTRAERRLSGEVAFKLHDTFGFPRELTRELAEDAGLAVDWERFEELMEEQRRRAREAARRVAVGVEAAAVPPSAFVGYERLEEEARIVALLDPEGRELEVAGEGREVRAFLDRTPFYAEAGGQVGDRGVIRTAGGLIRVEDARWAGPHAIAHLGRVEAGEVRVGEPAHAEVDRERREATMRAHTATHVVHWTLRHVLGEHARQAGSLVAPGRLRFDFPHPAPVPREELERAEELANLRLAEDAEVRVLHTSFEEAKAMGAIALFGEKYGDRVRVVEIGDWSRELCGGTHVPHTGRVAVIRFVGEGSIGAGMRRVEALVGPDAIRHVELERRLLDEVVEALGAGDPQAAPERARQVMARLKQLESELGRLARDALRARAERVAGRADVVAGARLVASLEDGDAEELRELAQLAVSRLEGEGGAAVVLGSARDGRALVVAACSRNLLARGVTAPLLLEPAARAVGGGSGGKPALGFAGGPRGDAVERAVGLIPARLEELLAAGPGG
ncbi:MAG TPA: alanine--tRNA ligase [Actinomycetota bacterium]|nr:alanine--tRNA ligase [Actinomycetota bacterium]